MTLWNSDKAMAADSVKSKMRMQVVGDERMEAQEETPE